MGDNSSKTPPEIVDVSGTSSSSGRSRRKGIKGFFSSLNEVSFTGRVMGGFVFVSFMTVLVAFGVLSLVWEQHFQEYTHDNMERLAESVASSIEEELEATNGRWTVEVLRPARSAAKLNEGTNVQVLDAAGVVIFDSFQDSSSDNILSFPKSSRGRMVSSTVRCEGKTVASVNVWVYGSDTLLTQADQEFRDQSYAAMIMAALLSVIISLVVGFVFSRALVDPINRITRTARAIKEGDEGARTGMRGDDEISRLGETFDAMAESIAKDRQMERRLTTDVAHELRTPLMAIQATVEAMVDGVFEPDAERLATIDAEVQRLSRLVDAQLKLSRLENRKTPINKEKVNLGEVISDVYVTHEAYVNDAGLDFVFEKQDDVYVYGDKDMLRQATANLISNAVRYTPSGSVTLKVSKGDIMASIQVKDTGIGLSTEEAKRVFDRFWRADEGRNRAQGGLGVGLSVVKEIVDRHNGWVRVEGKKGEGATFTILIPLYEDRQALGSKQQKPRGSSGSKQQKSRGASAPKQQKSRRRSSRSN